MHEVAPGDSLQSSRACLIKFSDFTDNGVGVIPTTGPKVVKLARTHTLLIPVLIELVARPDTPLSPHVKKRIIGQLLTAEERFAAIAPVAADTSQL